MLNRPIGVTCLEEQAAPVSRSPVVSEIPSTLRHARATMSAMLVAADMLSLLVAGTIAVTAWSFVRPDVSPVLYLELAPLTLFFVAIYAARQLYPAIAMSPVEELRRLTVTTTALFLILATLSFYVRNNLIFSRAIFGISWALALVLVPAGRSLARALAVRLSIWGEAVAVVGLGPKGRTVIEYLQKNPRLGLKPVVVLNGFDEDSGPVPDVAVFEFADWALGERLPELAGVKTAIVIGDETPQKWLSAIIDEHAGEFERLIVISGSRQPGSLWVTPCDLGGVLGLEVRQNLLNARQRFVKRALDIVAVLAGGIVLVPVFAAISAIIKISAGGNLFYGQRRIGLSSARFRMWKFCSMVPDADRVLQSYLDRDPELRREWDADHKLKNDPRVTWVGRYLRSWSLDELPQLWNVLVGEMSLVGPRPIVDAEVIKYGHRYKYYAAVRPGITGMWQVSGRNNVTYDERTLLDEYYVRNWSVWLDIYILVRTLGIVVRRSGAY